MLVFSSAYADGFGETAGFLYFNMTPSSNQSLVWTLINGFNTTLYFNISTGTMTPQIPSQSANVSVNQTSFSFNWEISNRYNTTLLYNTSSLSLVPAFPSTTNYLYFNMAPDSTQTQNYTIQNPYNTTISYSITPFSEQRVNLTYSSLSGNVSAHSKASVSVTAHVFGNSTYLTVPVALQLYLPSSATCPN